MMEHLFQGLYGVDAPAHWGAYSAPLPKPHNWFQWGFAAGAKNGGILWEEFAEGGGRGETEREREGEKGRERKRRIAPIVGDRCLCQWGPGQSPPPGGKTNFTYFSLHKALLVDRYSNILQHRDATFMSWLLILPGGRLPPCPNLETVCLNPAPLWKALERCFNK